MNGNNGVPGAKTSLTTTDFCKLFSFFSTNHNNSRILLSDWLSAALFETINLTGQFTRHARCYWTVRQRLLI